MGDFPEDYTDPDLNLPPKKQFVLDDSLNSDPEESEFINECINEMNIYLHGIRYPVGLNHFVFKSIMQESKALDEIQSNLRKHVQGFAINLRVARALTEPSQTIYSETKVTGEARQIIESFIANNEKIRENLNSVNRMVKIYINDIVNSFSKEIYDILNDII